MKLFAVAAIAAMLLGAAPAAAQVNRVPTVGMSGAQFFIHCADAQRVNRGPQVAACVTYAMGISDGLQAAGLACTGTRVAPQRLYAVSMWWIRNHWQAARNPAVVMISHGFENVYSCRSASVQSRATAEQQAAQMEKFVTMLTGVKDVVEILAAL